MIWSGHSLYMSCRGMCDVWPGENIEYQNWSKFCLYKIVFAKFQLWTQKLFLKLATVTILSTESSPTTNAILRSSNKKHPLFYLRITSFSDYLVSRCKWTSPDEISHSAKNIIVDKATGQNLSRNIENCWIRATQRLKRHYAVASVRRHVSVCRANKNFHSIW